MHQVGQTLGRVGPGADRLARVLGYSTPALIAMRLREEEKPKLVDAASTG
jgi:hypothetical protein